MGQVGLGVEIRTMASHCGHSALIHFSLLLVRYPHYLDGRLADCHIYQEVENLRLNLSQ